MVKVSIVIPAYNAERFIVPTVESVLAQTMPDWELVVVDDGSQDATGEIVRRYAQREERIRLLIQANAGQSVARNNGYALTDPEADYVIFLDADDIWEPEALAVLSEALGARPEAVAVHGLARYIDAEGRVIRPGEMETRFRRRYGIEGNRLVPWPLERPTEFAVEVVENYVATPGVILIRRECLETVGLFDARCKGTEDWDLWLRLCRQGPISFLDRVLLSYRRHESNTSSNGQAMFAADLYVRRQLLLSPDNDTEQRRLALLGYRYRTRHIMREQLALATESLRRGQPGAALKRLRHALLTGWRYAREPSRKVAMIHPSRL